MSRIIATVIGVVFGLILPAQLALAGDERWPPFPALTAQWWQWAMSIPTKQNPQLDDSGQYCMVGQWGGVWFLAGVSGGGTATRACSIPEGDAVFFPVINNFWNNTPDCGQGGVNYDVKQLIANIKPEIDSTRNLSVMLDEKFLGKREIQRVVSIPFASVFPADNVFGPNACDTGIPLPAGIYSPSMDEGYYVLLPPLKVGQHTLHFHAESGTQAEPFVQDVTYNLTVEPISLK
jgi:hypothetical protein